MDTSEPIKERNVIVMAVPKSLQATPEYLSELGYSTEEIGELSREQPVTIIPVYGSDYLLRQMSENLKTQDNAGTADPMFVVFQKQLVAGLESGYEDFWLWVSDDDGDYEEADKDTAVVLARLHEEGGPLVIGARTYRRTGCKYIEKFCAAFFTQKGADDYLAWNGHNLTQPYVYVHGMYRNAEMIAVRNYFMGKE